MQTILGAGGAIGSILAKELLKFTDQIRLVSRNPKRVNEKDLLFSADLSDPNQIDAAVAGSEVVYVTVGFEYKIGVWRKQWPPFMRATIDACLKHKAKLVFFDNVYAIGKDHVHHITEQSPISPSSKKGEIRAEVDRMVLNAVEKGTLEAIIARAPDFYGPIKANSVLMSMIYDNFAKGKAAQWLCKSDVMHSMGYTPDLAKGTAMLGNTNSAYNQIWNLPTDPTAPTGKEWAQLFADEMGVKNTMQVLPGWGIRLLGLFIPILGEFYEMRYQYDRPYFFDSSKFNSAFNFTPTSNEEAVKATIQALKS